MITKADIEKLPTKLRNDITEHLKNCIERAEKTKRDSADMFVFTTDEKNRSNALIAQGELNAFTALYNIFKKGMGE